MGIMIRRVYGDSPTLARAVTFLHDILEHGPVPSTQAMTQCREAGFSPATIRRAKRKAGVVSRRESYSNESLSPEGIASLPWEWCLPGVSRNEHLAAKRTLSGNTLVGKFVAACLEIGPGESISGPDLRDLFIDWRQAHGVSEHEFFRRQCEHHDPEGRACPSPQRFFRST
jgi:hypothetical protein